MRCTKCSGTGSEGYISFLRCGRCSGTGDEPKDALIPYSEDLIVVPKGPVITALREDPEAVEKKLTEASEKKKEDGKRAAAGGLDAFAGTHLPLAPRSSARIPRAAGAQRPYNNSTQMLNSGLQPEEEKPYIQPISKFFDLTLRGLENMVANKHDFAFSFGDLAKDLYNQDFFLHEIRFDSAGKYMVKAFHQGRMILEAFYTGLDVKAVLDDSCKISPYHDIMFEMDPQDRNPALPEDRIAVTIWLEQRVVEPLIHRPSYTGNYFGSYAPR